MVSSRFDGHSGTVRVQLSGVPVGSGIYQLPPGASVETVIIMAVGRIPSKLHGSAMLGRRLRDGDSLSVKDVNKEHAEITVKSIPVKERMVLGIPLDPTTMTEAEWELLPGIGPTLARRIMEYRQHNGGFRSWQELEKVPGIGPGTLKKLHQYFLTVRNVP